MVLLNLYDISEEAKLQGQRNNGFQGTGLGVAKVSLPNFSLRKSFEVTELFIVVVTWLCAFMKTHKTVEKKTEVYWMQIWTDSDD